MIRLKYLFISICCFSLATSCPAQKEKIKSKTNNTKTKIKVDKVNSSSIIPGAERLNEYLPQLKGKRVAIFANNTAMVGNTHLVDTLLKLGVTIKVAFGPEHGFRGKAPDGAKVETTIDKATGIPIVSLYGQKNKPGKEDLKDVDVMVYDIQDVGTRFYTFISSMQLYMEAAIENNIPLIILDRPNPNGFYVDGPVLDPKFKSFVGMQPVPVVYGMTIGEYAQMLLQEGWLNKDANETYKRIIAARYASGAKFFQLRVVECSNYTHKSKYVLPVKPSPNIPEIQSVYWYASHCFFEGTVISEGRGTPKPFEWVGHPSLPKNLFSFTPHATEGAPSPKYKDQACYGWNLSGTPQEVLKMIDGRLQLKYLLEAYKMFPDKEHFFKKDNGFNRLAGTDELMKQIKDGKSEQEIRTSWEPKLTEFKKIRKKYLLYPDFE
ncbi:MAG: exo-beta-N-acetylmuramidase NamZ family protein [Flavisolibacter sp.]